MDTKINIKQFFALSSFPENNTSMCLYCNLKAKIRFLSFSCEMYLPGCFTYSDTDISICVEVECILFQLKAADRV